MQNLIKLIKQFRLESPLLTHQDLINHMREYLQILILRSVYHSKYGSAISFMGGTCLRICYNLKRYSEDLNFALDKKNRGYSFGRLIEVVKKDLGETGFNVDVTVNDETVVQKAYLSFNELLQSMGLPSRKGQKIHIKLEVDVGSVKVGNDQLESFFVSKYNEIFPILKHKKETLFAGKLLAILSRTYTKGRDYYDLIWYLKENTAIDGKYLKDGIVQINKKLSSPIPQFKLTADLFDYLTRQIAKIDAAVILKDIEKFLEEPEEKRWIKDYKNVFAQFASSYLSTENLK